MNTITVPVFLSLADDPFAENAADFPKEVTITVSDLFKAKLESTDKSVASRAFDDLEDLIKDHLEKIGLGGVSFDFG